MFKRPCCLLAAGILFIQLILVGWFQISRDLKPSYLEQNYLENENVIIEGKVYDVDKNECLTSVIQFLEQLKENGFIDIK